MGKNKHHSIDAIFEENAGESDQISPTRQNSRSPTIKDRKPTSKILEAEQKAGSNSKKRKRISKEKKKKGSKEEIGEVQVFEEIGEKEPIEGKGLFFQSNSSPQEFDGISEPNSKSLDAEKKSVSNYSKRGKKKDSKHDDNDKEKAENLIQDVVIEEAEHAAQVEGKSDLFQSTSSTPKVDGDSEYMPNNKSGNPNSKTQREEQKEEMSCGFGLTGTRVFTEDDELILLQCKIDFGLLHKVPASSVSASVLHEFLKGKLHYDFSNNQINEKIRRLKERFVKNGEMVEKCGGEIAASLRPHEVLVFELSKKIWGEENNENVEDRILVEDSSNGIDVKAKKKIINKAKRSSTPEFGANEAAVDDKDGEVSTKKKRLMEAIEKVTKKIKLLLELAQLEYDELKKEG
ncbi:OLC1v1007762C1 [Oldenlandia corymbosa var. corymbosa]|uniref:OLC1v1007762C1 n=1 Tax=Oldenlandia corymbosa var. corymbosa TaxID=529605 RepID=A0AAV1DME9_OLDCO|nr:OLC1v1007762C1 [Oldenlandia corymbosa var. corymbosa]